MTEHHSSPGLPFERLAAFTVAIELIGVVRGAAIRDASLRDQALRAAKSAALNVAEGTGRVTPADKRRAFAIARGEGSEAVGALVIAVAAGDADAEHLALALPLGRRLYALLTGLLRS